MGIFGRGTARRRLRRATEESLTVPTFSAPVDCAPWVIGDLWPTELSSTIGETTTLADYLRTDLQRIADSANTDLQVVARSGMAYSARRAAEARIIEDARALAMRRVDSTMRQLRRLRGRGPAGHPSLPAVGRPPTPADRADMDKTQIIPAVRDVPRAISPAAIDMDRTRVIPAIRDVPPSAEPDSAAAESAALAEVAQSPPETNELAVEATEDDPRLQRLLAFVARQEPRLSWAIGERPDGTTLLVTDLAHGWIPPGITIPEGVELLEPGLRNARTSELLGAVVRSASYGPANSANWPIDLGDIPSSEQARQLPAVQDFGWELGVATHWREGVPRLVHTLAKATTAGADIVEQEIDLLRVHLDTARYQILAQYPDSEPAQVLNCMLLAATEGSVSGDMVSANYHFAWFRQLDAKSVDAKVNSGPDNTRSPN